MRITFTDYPKEYIPLGVSEKHYICLDGEEVGILDRLMDHWFIRFFNDAPCCHRHLIGSDYEFPIYFDSYEDACKEVTDFLECKLARNEKLTELERQIEFKRIKEASR